MKLKFTYRLLTMLSAFLILASILLVSCGVCEHNYKDGVCADCGATDPDYVPPCSHIFKEGVCTECGEADPDYDEPCAHSFSDGECVHCGEPCAHNYVNGVCIICIRVCPHDYKDGVCAECGNVCLHSYSYGSCVGCGIPCPHIFVNGACAKCDAPCEHSYEDGACTVCGAEDPDYLRKDAGRRFYTELVNKYKSLVLYKATNAELPPKGDSEADYVDALYEVVGEFQPYSRFGYSYRDLDGDGYVELLLIENTNRIYALFTIENEAPRLVTTFPQGMGYLTRKGEIFYNVKRFDSNGQIFLSYNITRLEGGRLVGISYGWEDADEDYTTTGDEIYFAIEDGVRRELSYEEYKAYRTPYTYYWESSTRLTKLADLCYNPALGTELLTEHVADFSSYDAIIKTFGLILSDVAGGRLSRTDFIAGDYDEGMIFESEEDFVIYNRLIAACTLASNSSRYGYAEQDLNGDGVSELVVLDANYNVLAIFTLSRDVPVLLDSYDDLRRAFIDDEGLIHVEVTMVPGSEDDREYFVYEIKDGAMVIRIAIGIERDPSGESDRIYDLSGGARVNIEKVLWDELYARFAKDIGSSTYGQYTEENSGLTFKELLAD